MLLFSALQVRLFEMGYNLWWVKQFYFYYQKIKHWWSLLLEIFQLQVGLQSNVPQPHELYEEDDDVDAALSELQVRNDIFYKKRIMNPFDIYISLIIFTEISFRTDFSWGLCSIWVWISRSKYYSNP